MLKCMKKINTIYKMGGVKLVSGAKVKIAKGKKYKKNSFYKLFLLLIII